MALTKARNRMIEGASANVLDFGAAADGVTDDLLKFKAALEFLEAQGGGSLYVPAGVYAVSKPIIVRSNIELYGDGEASEIKNITDGAYTPGGDAIHIGISNGWGDWTGATGGITDAALSQFDAGDYSKLTTSNVIVRDIHVSTNHTAGQQGMGIWAKNAQRVFIENIYASNTATPVNIANDNPTNLAGCRNVIVDGVYNITAGRWYDLVFVGQAEAVTIQNCKNNPASPSTLDAALTVGDIARYVKFVNNYIQFDSKGSKVGLEITGPVSVPTEPNFVEDNTFINCSVGIVSYQFDNQIIRNNTVIDCTDGIRLYGTGHQVAANIFKGCTNDLNFKSGSSSTCTGMILNRSRITGDADADIERQIVRGCVGYGGVRRKVFWPPDWNIDDSDSANVTVDGGALVQTDGTAQVQLWTRLPDDLGFVEDFEIKWYAAAASEAVSVSLYKRETFANVNSLTQISTTQTSTSASSGDQTLLWSGIDHAVTNPDANQLDQYYLMVNINFANVNSQFRASQLKYQSSGSRS